MVEDPSSSVALNPASPASLGALLAEEWTIDPFSPLPSFVERAMMSEASRSAHQFVGTAIAAAAEGLSWQLQQLQQQQHLRMADPHIGNDASEEDGDEFSESRRRFWHFLESLRRCLSRVGYVCRQRIAASAASALRQYRLELQCLTVFLIERHSLIQYGGMVGETLYGGKRVKLGAVTTTLTADDHTPSSSSIQRALKPLSRGEASRLALLTVVLPYLYEKCDQGTRRRPEYAPSSSSPAFAMSIWRDQGLSLLRTTLALVDLYCRWSYLMGRSVHYDVVSLALQHVVRRVTEQDQLASPPTSSTLKAGEADGPQEVEHSDGPPPDATKDSTLPSLEKVAQLARQSLLYMMVGTLAVSWLTQVRYAYVTYRRDRAVREYQRRLQQQPPHPREQEPSTSANSAYLDEADPSEAPATENGSSIQPWWSDSDSSDIPPPPPAVPVPNERGVPAGTCPLCRRSERRKPTASSSGYVFCFACILEYAQRRRKCPITGARCLEDDLIRLYEPDPALHSNGSGM